MPHPSRWDRFRSGECDGAHERVDLVRVSIVITLRPAAIETANEILIEGESIARNTVLNHQPAERHLHLN